MISTLVVGTLLILLGSVYVHDYKQPQNGKLSFFGVDLKEEYVNQAEIQKTAFVNPDASKTRAVVNNPQLDGFVIVDNSGNVLDAFEELPAKMKQLDPDDVYAEAHKHMGKIITAGHFMSDDRIVFFVQLWF